MTSNTLFDGNNPKSQPMIVPIAQLSTLGAAVSSLIPSLRAVTQTTSLNTQELYRLANAEIGDVLKVAKNGNSWGALKTAEGKSKMAQFQAVAPLSETNTITMPIDPATMMIAVALFSIEQQLGNIAEMEMQILTFLENEKESQIEADVKMLSSIVSSYKNTWDSQYFVSSNHQIVLAIERTARKNMISYQKEVSEILGAKKIIVSQSKVSSTLETLVKKFKYYRLSLYTFSLASMLKIMLSGDFKEEIIACAKAEIEELSMTYREMYGKCSLFLENMSKRSLEDKLLKGVGVTGKTVGKVIGSIPIVKEGPVDEFLQKSGSQLEQNAVNNENRIVESFAKISNPGVGVFTEEMEKMIQIFNHTKDIFFDEKNIYLVAG